MFTTLCFIKKNTPELVTKLKKLGYKNDGLYYIDEKYICTIDDKILSKNYLIEIPDKARFNYCEIYEDLFLAIAALRNDSDKYQWFTDGKTWFECQYESIKEYRKEAKDNNYYSAWIYDCHKATVKELVEYFKPNKIEISKNKKSEQEIFSFKYWRKNL